MLLTYMENLIDRYLSDDKMGLPQTNLKVGPSDKLAEVGNEAFAESLAATPSALDKGSASTSEKGVVSVR